MFLIHKKHIHPPTHTHTRTLPHSRTHARTHARTHHIRSYDTHYTHNNAYFRDNNNPVPTQYYNIFNIISLNYKNN